MDKRAGRWKTPASVKRAESMFEKYESSQKKIENQMSITLVSTLACV